MSKDLNDVDWGNLSDDDQRYFDQRPWLKEQYERVSGKPFPGRDEATSEPTLQQLSASNASTDTSGDPSGPPAGGVETPDDVPDDYNDWRNDQLRDEIDARNAEYGESSERRMSKSGNKSDLVNALVADDELREQDEDDESSDDNG